MVISKIYFDIFIGFIFHTLTLLKTEEGAKNKPTKLMNQLRQINQNILVEIQKMPASTGEPSQDYTPCYTKLVFVKFCKRDSMRENLYKL